MYTSEINRNIKTAFNIFKYIEFLNSVKTEISEKNIKKVM